MNDELKSMIATEVQNICILCVFMTCWLALTGVELKGEFSWSGLVAGIFGFLFIIFIRIFPYIYVLKKIN
jgi:hypothetical protein